MKRIIDYLTNPATRIGFIVVVFWLGTVRATTNNRIDVLEEKIWEVDSVKIQMYEIQTTLWQIQTDILRIKQYLVK